MPNERRGLLWEFLREPAILVSYYDGEASDNQWEAYVELLRSLRSEAQLRCLVYVLEQPPLARIDPMMEAVRGLSWRVALVSPSTPVRFIASTFSLVIRRVRFFSPDLLPKAFEHLGCSEQEQLLVQESLDRLSGGST